MTEWPASEKSHLESLSHRGAILVAYSGCELHILDECKVSGAYSFERTTEATDTIEVRSDDELFAKLPLGALSLQAELARSGRIAVRTTVVGQRRLTSTGVDDVPSDSACSEATHIVSGISVGAFEMLSGGALTGGAAVAAGSVAGGGRVQREEKVYRRAGDERSCGRTNDASPDPGCSAPVQIFLTPLRRAGGVVAAPAPARRPASSEAAPFPVTAYGVASETPAPSNLGAAVPNASLVYFRPPELEPWVLHSKDGGVVCRLPCAQWLAPSSGLFVQLDADRASDAVKISVPNELGFSPGRTLSATPKPARGIKALANVAYGLSGASAGIGTVLWAANCGGNSGVADNGVGECAAAKGMLVGAAGLSLLAMIYHVALVRSDELVMRLEKGP